MNKIFILRSVLFGLMLAFLPANSVFAQTTVFTYQGKLTDTGTPQAIYQMEFRLFGSAAGSDQIGATVTNTNVAVNQGVFTVNLDFGAAAFSGADRFLQISVRRSTNESFITLNPRQQITSSPYSIRTLSAAQADVALDSNKLGGVDANQYVTTSSVGNSFIRNSTAQQTGANFNIDGSGIVGGSVGIGTNPFAGYKLDVNGDTLVRTSGSGGNIQLGTPSAETGMTFLKTNRADIRFDNSTLKLFAGAGTAPPGNGIAINTLGNVGIGTLSPATRLALNGGPAWTSAFWTGSLSMGNASALGWGANASGQRFGIGQSNGGLYFFRTNSAFGTTGSPANYDMQITDTGNITQPVNNNGLVKAMVYVDPSLPPSQSIVRCYNGVTNQSSNGCGFRFESAADPGLYFVNFGSGFDLSNRFISLTLGSTGRHIGAAHAQNDGVAVFVQKADTPQGADIRFYLIIY